jgi:outer membrane protein assembly factor BamB
MERKHSFLGICATTLFSISLATAATDWPQWRGPNLNGSSPAKNLPASWSDTSNVLWKVELPGWSGSTPIIHGKHVFVSSPDQQKNLVLLAFDRENGKELWRQTVAPGDRATDRGNNMTSPSPVTDGERVIVLYGTGDIAAFDFSGKQLWKESIARKYGKFSHMWLYGASPLLFDGKLYVQVLQRDDPKHYAHAVDDKATRESFLLCLDPKTGKELWRHVRPTDAIVESQESYATPVPFKTAKGTEIVVVGGDYATGHDPASGKELWRSGKLNSKKNPYFRIITSPVSWNGFVYASAPKREPLHAIREGGQGNVTDSHIAWSFTENPPDVCTPLVYQDRLYVLDGDKKVMTCLNPKTGEKIWQGELGVREVFKSSPTGADGKIYCISERGTAVVLEAGEQFKILATIPVGQEPVRSSMPATDGQLFIRTGTHLWCIGYKK